MFISNYFSIKSLMNKTQLLFCFLLLSSAFAQEGLTITESWVGEGEEWVCEAENEWWENGEGEWANEGEDVEGEAQFLDDSDSNFRHYCDPSDSNGDVCPDIYEPVCGYVTGGDGVDYSNSCFACTNGADYYTEGECPN